MIKLLEINLDSLLENTTIKATDKKGILEEAVI
jgi:hypothetical protein